MATTNRQACVRSFALNALVLFALLCMCLLLSCIEHSHEPTVFEPQPVLFTPPPSARADSMHVHDSTYARVKRLFAENYDAGTNNPVRHTVQEVAWDLLAAHVPQDSTKHAIVFDYGLKNDSLRFGISFTKLEDVAPPEVYSYRLPDTLHALLAGSLPGTPAYRWRATYQYDSLHPAAYFSKVRVRHMPTDPPTLVRYGTDAHADVIAWEDELMALYNDNAEGHGDSTFHVVITAIARTEAHGELRHRTCLHLRLRAKNEPSGPYRDLLDNSRDPAHLLRMHACDLGNLCPPGCAIYRLPPR